MIIKNCKDVSLEATQAPGAGIRWMLTKEDGAPGFALRVCVVEAGAESPYHEHDWEHELFVLDGDGAIRSGDDLTRSSRGMRC
jgi:quercetin dioxygenase-like cupin family protein